MINIIFDFDKTIIDKDTDEQVKTLLNQDIVKNLEQKYFNNEVNWTKHMNEIYKEIEKTGINIKDILETVNKLSLNSEFNLLFDYLEKNKNIFELNIISSANKLLIESILNKNKINLFKNIIAFPYEIKNNLIIQKDIGLNNDCEFCSGDICKSLLFKNNFDINQKIIFICDGWNDYCLAKNLKKNDILCTRKNYKLYKMLNNNKYKISCQNYCFENGKDIINLLEKLI